MDDDRWRKLRTSGSFKRKLSKNLSNILKTTLSEHAVTSHQEKDVGTSESINHMHESQPRSIFPVMPANATKESDRDLLQQFNLADDGWPYSVDDPCDQETAHSDDEDEEEDDTECKNEVLLSSLRSWSIAHNIKQNALKDLIEIINARLSKVLPDDPRTLLQTPKTVSIQSVGDGQYWHHGLRRCLENLFANTSNSRTIAININLDGLPVYRSSKDEFWPILFNIHEMPHIKPMVIVIYRGKNKPSNLNTFLDQFVDEMNDVLKNGISINEHKISIKLRCFICDSPARAFVKGKHQI